MSKNIEINIQLSTGNYEVLYPKTLGSLVSGAVSNATTSASCTGNAATATKLATSRSFTTNLGQGYSGSFDGTNNCTVGITGTLGVSYGGTGTTSYSSLASYLSPYINAAPPAGSCIMSEVSWTGNGSTGWRSISIPTYSNYSLFALSIGTATIGSGSTHLGCFLGSNRLVTVKDINNNGYARWQYYGEVNGSVGVTASVDTYLDYGVGYIEVKNGTSGSITTGLNVNSMGYKAILFYTKS